MRIVWVALLAIACTGVTLPEDEPDRSEPDATRDWRFEPLGDSYTGLDPIILSRPDGSLWMLASDPYVLVEDPYCARGSTLRSVFASFVGTSGAWSEGPRLDLRAPLPSVAVDASGALWSTTTESMWFGPPWCGPDALAVQTAGRTETWARGEILLQADGEEVRPESQVAGGWPSLAFDTQGSPLLAHSRIRLGDAPGDETLQVELLRGPGQVEVVDAGAGRFLVLLTDREAPELLGADRDSLYSRVRTDTGWTRTRVGTAPGSHAPDVAILPDGTRLGVLVDVDGQAVELRDAGQGWSARPLDLPAPPIDRIAIDTEDAHTLIAYSDGSRIHVITDGPDGREELAVPSPVDRDCSEVDVAIADGTVHLAMSCPSSRGFQPNLFHGWRAL